ncbi:MAG TPA: hypothetical protein VNV16_00355 [Methylibium sp.]|nr:hypothetical protein [Methylibium sp.]
MRLPPRSLALLIGLLGLAAAARADEDPRSFVQFVEEHAGQCVMRGGVQILVRSSHPRRTIKVWLDRYVSGVGTGDRSRSQLAPGGEAEALGCSRNSDAAQEWRIVRAEFVD